MDARKDAMRAAMHRRDEALDARPFLSRLLEGQRECAVSEYFAHKDRIDPAAFVYALAVVERAIIAVIKDGAEAAKNLAACDANPEAWAESLRKYGYYPEE